MDPTSGSMAEAWANQHARLEYSMSSADVLKIRHA